VAMLRRWRLGLELDAADEAVALALSGGEISVPPLISPEREAMQAVGKADKEMAQYTLLHVEGHGVALYLSFEKKIMGANQHTLYACKAGALRTLALRDLSWRVLALPSEPAAQQPKRRHTLRLPQTATEEDCLAAEEECLAAAAEAERRRPEDKIAKAAGAVLRVDGAGNAETNGYYRKGGALSLTASSSALDHPRNEARKDRHL